MPVPVLLVAAGTVIGFVGRALVLSGREKKEIVKSQKGRRFHVERIAGSAALDRHWRNGRSQTR